jgi:hypothetical protein
MGAERKKLLLLLAATAATTHGGWVDPDTPEEGLKTTSFFKEDTREYELVSYIDL